VETDAAVAPAFNPRRLQLLAGALALVLLAAFSVSQLTGRHGNATAGLPAGKPARLFAAPLATSNLTGDANLQPSCRSGHHDPRALNLCLLVQRGPVVLDFFVTGSTSCEQEVSTMQSIASRYRARGVQFAAVVVRADRRQAAAAVRRYGWTLPVAYDRDGAVGESYGVVVCPLVELVRQGGIVAKRLIGRSWLSAPALAAQVQTLAGP
jgi:peroxiredoxin